MRMFKSLVIQEEIVTFWSYFLIICVMNDVNVNWASNPLTQLWTTEDAAADIWAASLSPNNKHTRSLRVKMSDSRVFQVMLYYWEDVLQLTREPLAVT